MAVNMAAVSVSMGDWVAGGDGKVRGSDPEGNEGGGIPLAPTAFTASYLSDTSLSLAWTDNATDELNYELDRSLTGTGGWTALSDPAANATSATSTSLTVDTQYYYRLRAVNASGNSSYAIANGTTTASVSVVSMSLDLTTAGRLGFYVDYSELATTGTHTFYVIRTHGTTGAVSCGYSTGGDTHTTVSGTLSWADGEADIKSFTATVSSKSAGDHRMWALLDTPTGSAVLHNGATHTRAFGVIDDGTIAGDSDAVFYDSAATGGTGTQADPYDSIYTAIANAGSKRYIYGKGTSVVDGTHTDNITGNTVQVLPVPATRADEGARVYIRNWPGSTWTVTGDGGTDNGGFFSGAAVAYHTYRGLDFSALDNSSRTNGFGIHYNSNSAVGINVELCTFDNINGFNGSNHAGFSPFGTDGYRMWRSTANNIQNAGDNANINTAGLLTFTGTNGSAQRCTITNTYHGIYHKQTVSGAVSTACRFNFLDGVLEGIAMRESGGSNDGHTYVVIQNNLFKDNTNRGIFNWTTIDGGGTPGDKFAISNNVFDTCAASDRAAIHFRAAFNTQIYNNIMVDCREVWTDYQDAESWQTPDVEYADYNVEFGTTSTRYVYRGTGYATAAALFSSTGFGGNDVSADPVFTNRVTDDYTLDTGSAAIAAGISGVDCGLYLAGIEVIGAAL